MKNDGGPAFPMPSGDEPKVNETTHYNEGMPLRDWFAGMAMKNLTRSDGPFMLHPAELAVWAYDIADAMIAEREKGK